MQTIATFKSNFQRKLHGTSLATITSPNDLIAEAAGNLLREIHSNETIRWSPLPNTLHDKVFDYQLPSDVNENWIIDIRPQVNREENDNFSQIFSEQFDLFKDRGNNMFNIKYDEGVKSLRVAKTISPAPITIDTVSGITANGTWAVTPDATNLTEDKVNFITGSLSLNYDFLGLTATGFIENSTLDATDLTAHDEQSTLFVWVFIPSTTNLTSYNLRWGNDTSNFWSRTVTAAFPSTEFQVGWNLLGFEWNGATETGTVDPSVIDYIRLTTTFSSATTVTDFRMDNITSSLGRIFEIGYYSKFLFTNSSGTFIEAPTADTDTINLDTASYNILLYETAYLAAQEIQGEDATFDLNFFKQKLYGDGSENNVGLYETYRRANPPERIIPQTTYYRTSINSRRRGGGRRFIN